MPKKFLLPANHVSKVFRNHTKLWFAGKRKKMSIAPLAQKLLRIVFCTYICFPGFQIPKKCFVGDRCVSLGDLRFQDCARIGWGLWIAIPVLVCVGLKWVCGMHPEFARISVEWTVMTCSSTGAIARILLGVFREWVLTQYFWGYGYCSFVGWGGRGSFWSISARFSLHCLLRPTPGLFYILRHVRWAIVAELWVDCGLRWDWRYWSCSWLISVRFCLHWCFVDSPCSIFSGRSRTLIVAGFYDCEKIVLIVGHCMG